MPAARTGEFSGTRRAANVQSRFARPRDAAQKRDSTFRRWLRYGRCMKYTLTALLFLAAAPLTAAEPVIEQVQVRAESGGTYRFDVTIRHPDTGWEHYADGWRVLDMAGNELGMRVLYHPHVDEQPFTRSLGGVAVPAGATQVQIQARDLPEGWNSGTMIVDLPNR